MSQVFNKLCEFSAELATITQAKNNPDIMIFHLKPLQNESTDKNASSVRPPFTVAELTEMSKNSKP